MRLVGVLADSSQCPALAQQIPALIDLDLNRPEAGSLVLGQRFLALQVMFLQDQFFNASEDRSVGDMVLHVCFQPSCPRLRASEEML